MAPVEFVRVQPRILVLHELANTTAGPIQQAFACRVLCRHHFTRLPPPHHAMPASTGTTESTRDGSLLLPQDFSVAVRSSTMSPLLCFFAVAAIAIAWNSALHPSHTRCSHVALILYFNILILEDLQFWPREFDTTSSMMIKDHLLLTSMTMIPQLHLSQSTWPDRAVPRTRHFFQICRSKTRVLQSSRIPRSSTKIQRSSSPFTDSGPSSG
ncbi:hypothetical protein AXF42_Ash021185 [Apostasia shenzhenica]|uniref:Uncharacterized protein n=1 Tax=Apostasia shenzhenica TaxID=1088818 RepID=A0A2I0AA59_9ASPA|nr:hypothetical protein AXF42_Ash021185 [Apostasia shenzhenica]